MGVRWGPEERTVNLLLIYVFDRIVIGVTGRCWLIERVVEIRVHRDEVVEKPGAAILPLLRR